jgi:hypothetical protein
MLDYPFLGHVEQYVEMLEALDTHLGSDPNTNVGNHFNFVQPAWVYLKDASSHVHIGHNNSFERGTLPLHCVDLPQDTAAGL